MSPTELQEVRATPLFADLRDDQLTCLDGGEIVELPAGTALMAEGSAADYFYVLLTGELRITRTYDRQSILMAVVKPGNYTGETAILLDSPWQATVRVSNRHEYSDSIKTIIGG